MILLKKEANKIFEANKLPELTVDIQNGFLQIVGRKCGQPLMMINGLNPGNKMTKEEREIVLNDYLIPVITRHKKDFDDVISIKRAGKALTTNMYAVVKKTNKLKSLRVQVRTSHNYIASKASLKVTAHLDLPGQNGVVTFSTIEIAINSCSYSDFDKLYKLVKTYMPEVKAIEALVEKVIVNNAKSDEAQAKLATLCGW